jgi:hypothetical protein
MSLPIRTTGGTPMNRAEIATATRQYLHELGTSYVTGTVMLNAIQRAGRRINRESKMYVGDITLTLATGTYEYAFPTACIEVKRVRLGTSRTRLTSMAPSDADETLTGTPTRYYTEGQLIGFDRAYATAPTSAYIRCVKSPGPLSSASSVPTWLPSDYHDTYSKCAAIDLAGGFEAGEENMPIRQSTLYMEYLAEIRDITAIAANRSQEHTQKIRPTGYQAFRR